MSSYSNRVGCYGRKTNTFNSVDFSERHDPDEYLHYKFVVMENGRKRWFYESIQKSTLEVVYRGHTSYHHRKKGILTTETTEGFVNITTDDELQQRMKEVLSEETDE